MKLIQQQRNQKSNPSHLNEDVKSLLQWLWDWRVSSISLISARLGMPLIKTMQFMESMCLLKIVEPVRSESFKIPHLFTLGPEGYRMLGVPRVARVVKRKWVKKYAERKSIYHDLHAQHAVIKLLPGSIGIASEFNIKMKWRRPDALVCYWKADRGAAFTVAVEVERFRKRSTSIYAIFRAYLRLLEEGKVQEVRFFFLNVRIRNAYLRYFNQELWPMGSKASKSRRRVAIIDWRRECFRFEVLTNLI